MAQAQAISCEMERQAKLLPRWDIIKESVANYGCAIVFDDLRTPAGWLMWSHPSIWRS